MKKYSLRQDTLLLGQDMTFMRRLVKSWAHYAGRELESIQLGKDTTVEDLKQRRELLQSSSLWFDQAAVRADPARAGT